MFLSIIVPVYNVEKYIKKCIYSILELKNIEYELILVLGESSDNSNILCEQYALLFPYIKISYQDGRGLSNARNCGVNIASGTFLMYIDSDDYIDAISLEKTLVKLSHLADMPDMLISDFFLLNKMEQIYGIRHQIYDTEHIIVSYDFLKIFLKHKQDYWNVWRAIYRLDFLKHHQIKFKENMKCEDIDYSTACLLKSHKIYFYHNPYYIYRVRREGSLVNVVTLKSIEDLVSIIEGCILMVLQHIEFPYSSLVIKKLLWEYFFSLFLIQNMDEVDRKKAIDIFKSKRYLFRYSDPFHIIYYIITISNVPMLSRFITGLRDFRRWLLKIK